MDKNKRRNSAPVLMLSLALVLAACGGGDEGSEAEGTSSPEAATAASTDAAAPSESGDLDLVKGTYSPIAAYAPLFVAIEEGFFEKYGIENQMDQVRINEALPLVANGDYDWGRSENSPGWFNAINSGLDVYGVVDRLTYECSADNALVVSSALAEEGATSFPDLEGKRIGIIAPGTQADYWLAQLLQDNDMTEADVEVVNLGYADQLAGLATGSLDAAFMLEPLLTQGVDDGSIVPIQSMLAVTPGANIGSMFFGGQFIERDDGDVAARWLAAWLEAARFAQDEANRDATLAAVQKWTEMDQSAVETIYNGTTAEQVPDTTSTWPQVNPNGRIPVDEILATQGQFMVDGGYIDELPPSEQVFNPEPLEAALEIVGEVDAEASQLCS